MNVNTVLTGVCIVQAVALAVAVAWLLSQRRMAASCRRDLHLLRDCLALGHPVRRRAPAKVRLEAELGPELAQKLVSSLSAAPRRPA